MKPEPRPLRWRCTWCDWVGNDAELLRAPSPFRVDDELIGCPFCRACRSLDNACDEPGCDAVATCGFPDPSGYRRTCELHMRWD